VVSSAGLPCNSDHLHFTANGYREFGKRYAETMLSILGYGEAGSNQPAKPRIEKQLATPSAK
jgi:hypothetical protein